MRFLGSCYSTVRAALSAAISDPAINGLVVKGLPALLLKIGSAALTFGMFVYLARWLGPDEYGRFAIMFSIATFSGFVVVGGLHTLALRTLPSLDATPDMGQAARLVRDGYIGIAGIGAVLAILASLLALFGERFSLSEAYIFSFALMLAIPMAIVEYQNNVLLGWKSVILALWPRDFLWRIMVLAAVGLLSISGRSVDALEAFGVAAASLVVVASLQYFLGIRERLRAPEASGQNLFSRAGARVAAASWLWAAGIAGALLPQVSVWAVGLTLNYTDAGVFFAAQRASALLALPLVVTNLVAAPLMAQAWATKDLRRLQQLCRMGALAGGIPTLLGLLIIMVFGEYMLAIFDESYRSQVAVLFVFSAGATVNAFCGPTGIIMLMTGNEKRYVWILAVSQTFGLGIVFIGATKFGLLGAACAAAIAVVIWNVLVWMWARKKLGIDPTILSVFFSARNGRI
jgi:O-antigen/teichoic acid export membrane protein